MFDFLSIFFPFTFRDSYPRTDLLFSFHVWISFALSFLKRYLPEDKIRGIKGLKITADGTGAVFDVPTDDVEVFTKGTFSWLK